MPSGAICGNGSGEPEIEAQNNEVQDAGGVNLVERTLEIPVISTVGGMSVMSVENPEDNRVAPSDLL